MKKLLSVSCSQTALNMGLLLLRLTSGILMMSHGYSKLIKFAALKSEFMNFLGMGSTLSLIMVIFAEFFCGLFLILGLFTRLAAIPLIITMIVATFKVHHADFFGEAEMATLYMGCFLSILIMGPGKLSVDGMIGK